jgi:hypothetical protein
VTKSKQIAAALSVLLDAHPHGNNPRTRAWGKHIIEHFLGAMEEQSDVEIEHLRIRSAETKQQLTKAISHLQSAQKVIATLPLRVRNSFDIEKQIRHARLWASVAHRPAHRVASKQRVAVDYAAMLFDLTEQRVGATRNGRWHKLSAILYGDPKADLFNHMLKSPHRAWITTRSWKTTAAPH